MLHQARRCGRRLEHRAVRREVAAQHRDAAVRRERVVERPDHLGVPVRRLLGSSPRCVWPLTVSASRWSRPRFAQRAHHRRQAAGVVEVLHQEPARRHQVDERRHVAAERVPVVERQRHADAAGDRQQMDDGVGRAADRAVDADRVLEGLARQDLRHAHVLARPSRRCGGRPGAPARSGASRRPGSRRCRGSDRPSASTMTAIVEAVPMRCRCPAERDMQASASMNCLQAHRAGLAPPR